jgi:hypothetical protein
MEWYTLVDDLATLKKLVAQGSLDYEAATKAVRSLINIYLQQR